jgi:two-component sensor histidine kinase
LVSSVLGLQSRGAVIKEAKDQIEGAQRRVHAIAMVHKQLHLGGSLENVEVGSFLTRLCESLKETAPESVTSVVVSAEPSSMRSDLASTLGLVAAELVTNGFKYAYANGGSGPIVMTFAVRPSGWQLSVADQGVGLPPDFDIAKGNGVGMKVVNALVRRLDAKITFDTSAAGTTFKISKD